jgi:hypothetical protein
MKRQRELEHENSNVFESLFEFLLNKSIIVPLTVSGVAYGETGTWA